jgi:hypothetical protein
MTLVSGVVWRSAAARLPTDGDGRKYLVVAAETVFLATREQGHWLDVAAYRGGADGATLTRYVIHQVSHWAELPAPPRQVRTTTFPEGVRTS